MEKITFLILLALGFSNRVIIFNDGLDLSQTLGIIIIPILAYFYVEITIPDGADDYLKNLHYQENSDVYFFLEIFEQLVRHHQYLI